MVGRYDQSLQLLASLTEAPYVSSRAKRELTQVYLHLEEYDKALSHAQINYNENRGNQFHIQAYFNCLIYSERATEKSGILQQLIKDLENIKSDQSNEMSLICKALFSAKIDKDKDMAIACILSCMTQFPGNHYPMLTWCDIAIKFNDINELEKAITKVEQTAQTKNISKRTINKYKAIYKALNGDITSALNIIEQDIEQYPNESKQRIINRLTEMAKTNATT